MDTLDFPSRNSTMPQISSTDLLLMPAQDMTDVLNRLHKRVHFSTLGDDTITALTTLAAILKNKLKSLQHQKS
jgi:hypothetical protein